MIERIELGLKAAHAGCSCGAAHGGGAVDTGAASAVTQEVLVEGMTCSHCISSVTEELSSLDGVDSVAVDLNAGGTSRVIIDSRIPIDADVIKAAVEEAGYALSVQS